jgi:predicted nucleotidyltransferase
MGTSRSKLAEALFSSVQQRVLATLFGNPHRSFFGNEILRATGSGKGALQRELNRLEAAGLITVRLVGNQKHYQANPASPIFQDLRNIVVKTVGTADVIARAMERLRDRIKVAFIYGSVAKNTDTSASDVDVLVVSDQLGYQDLYKALQPAERSLARKVSVTVYNSAELTKKLAARNAFVTRVLQQPKIFLVGGERDLR